MKLLRLFKDQKGMIPPIILIAGIGLIIFLIIASTADFKNKLFGSLYERKRSSASEVIPSPTISIKSPVDQYSTVITSPITVVTTWTGSGVTSVVTYLQDQSGINNLITLHTTTNPIGNSVSFNFNIPKTTTTPNTLKIKSIVTTSAPPPNNTAESQVTFKVTATDINSPVVSLIATTGTTLNCIPEKPCPSPFPIVTQGQNINFKASYSDDSGVTRLQLFRDDGKTKIQVGKDVRVSINSSVYPIVGSQTLVDDTSPVAGSYSYTVKASDGVWNPDSTYSIRNISESSPVQMTVTNNPPSVSVALTNPTNLSQDSGVYTAPKGVKLTFHTNYSDDVGVTKLEYYRSNSTTPILTQITNLGPVGTDKTDDTASLSTDITYYYTAKAYDAAGNVGTSTPIKVNLVTDKVLPTVSITSPITSTSAPYSIKSGSNMVIKTSESDDVGVIKIQYDVVDNGITTPLATKLAGTTPLTSDSLNFYVSGLLAPVKMAPGNHTISVKAYDAAGNMSTPANVYINVTSQ